MCDGDEVVFEGEGEGKVLAFFFLSFVHSSRFFGLRFRFDFRWKKSSTTFDQRCFSVLKYQR